MIDPLGTERPAAGISLSRRGFVSLVGSALGATHFPRFRPPKKSRPNLIAQFLDSLDPTQTKAICHPSNHPRRLAATLTRSLTSPTIADLTPVQRHLCGRIFKSLCRSEGYERFLRQMREDSGGFANYHPALFGEPGTDEPFEWVLAGRHVILRADGHSPDGSTFNGTVFFGHSATTENLWRSPGDRAETLFKSLSRRQHIQAIESGLGWNELDGHQRVILAAMFGDLTDPFRGLTREGMPESGRLIFDEPHSDREAPWNSWRLRSLSLSCYYHAKPHVHVWLDVAAREPLPSA